MAHIPRVYHPGPLGPGPMLLTGDAAKRLANVMRAAEGDPLLLFSGDGKEWRATVGPRGRDSLQVTVGEFARQFAAPSVVLESWVGVIRGPRFDDAIEKLVEAGADIIRPIVCEFSQRGEAVSSARLARWGRILIEASEQSGRLFIPEVLPPAPLARVLDSFHGAIVAGSSEGRPAAELAPLLPQSGHLAFAVGPEGGLSPAEQHALERRGALPLSLGPYILRTETAAVVGTGVLRALTTA